MGKYPPKIDMGNSFFFLHGIFVLLVYIQNNFLMGEKMFW